MLAQCACLLPVVPHRMFVAVEVPQWFAPVVRLVVEVGQVPPKWLTLPVHFVMWLVVLVA